NILDIYATAYLDDILIYSTNIADYVKQVKEVLKRLGKDGGVFSVNINKYEFYTIRTKYLGLIITLGSIDIDKEKVVAIIS
ncbi:hypothetical protein BT67DRAFT_384195, partial [Trichocladium antarcticum]